MEVAQTGHGPPLSLRPGSAGSAAHPVEELGAAALERLLRNLEVEASPTAGG